MIAFPLSFGVVRAKSGDLNLPVQKFSRACRFHNDITSGREESPRPRRLGFLLFFPLSVAIRGPLERGQRKPKRSQHPEREKTARDIRSRRSRPKGHVRGCLYEPGRDLEDRRRSRLAATGAADDAVASAVSDHAPDHHGGPHGQADRRSPAHQGEMRDQADGAYVRKTQRPKPHSPRRQSAGRTLFDEDGEQGKLMVRGLCGKIDSRNARHNARIVF